MYVVTSYVQCTLIHMIMSISLSDQEEYV